MRGDILFVHNTDIVSRLVQWRTHGPYCHVSLDLGDGTQLGAEPDGVKPRSLASLGGERYQVYLANAFPPEVVEHAVSTLLTLSQSASYSYADVLDDILPSWLFIRPLLSERKAFDCSDLMARYLDELGALPLSELGGEAVSVTPNDIARALKHKGYQFYRV